jgi:predicted permease
MMGAFLQDIRYAFRMLVKSPGFTLIAVASLALGIGANTAVFSVVDRALLRQLPVEEPERLVTFLSTEETRPKGVENSSFSYPLYKDYRDQNDVLDGLIAYFTASVNLSDGGQTERVTGELVTGNYFPVLGVRPAVGRMITLEDDLAPGAHPVAVLSYGLWKRRFGSDPSIVDKQVNINGHSYTIIGVAPSEFTGMERGSAPDLYLPIMMTTQAMPSWRDEGLSPLDARTMTWLEVMGRLKPDVTAEQAAASLSHLARQLKEQGLINVDPIIVLGDGSKGTDWRVRDMSNWLFLLLIAVGLVLLIACANVANLLLARATARQKEIAIRLAVGAGRGRLIRQLLTESLLLSSIGGALGIIIAVWLIDVLQGFRPSPSFSLDIQLDARVLGFSLAVSLVTGMLFGIAPALRASRPDLVTALKEDSGKTSRGLRRLSLRNTLVAVQVALSLLVLVLAGLCVRSLQNLQAIDAGFDPAKIMAAFVNVSLSGYEEERGKQFYSQLVERVSTLPGVESASMAAVVPLAGNSWRRSVKIPGHEPPPDGRPINFYMNLVDHNYFRTMGISLIEGREFTAQDKEGNTKVVIVNETLARRYWPDESAVGKFLDFGREAPEPILIVGVAKDSKYRRLTEPAEPTMYLTIQQFYEPGLALHVRTAAEAAAMQGAIRSVVQEMDQNVPVYSFRTLEEQKAYSLYTSRMAATLLSGYGVLALLLSAVGLYGVMSYSVGRRRHEIGIRMALGAGPRDILRMVLGEGMVVVAIGLVAGLGITLLVIKLGIAVFISEITANLLYGITATDPATYALIGGLLAAVALAACYVPARRATKVDPMIALRSE